MRYLAVLISILISFSSPVLANSQDDWDTASSIGAYGLAIYSLGAPIVKGDNAGALQAAGSLGGAQLASQALKYSFPETRPDGSDRKSFPSGHTATAFSAAASIYQRQGAKQGIPAFAIAGLVGVARVKAKKHFWYDAVAGAAIGLTSGLIITKKINQNTMLVPFGDSKGGGIGMIMRF